MPDEPCGESVSLEVMYRILLNMVVLGAGRRSKAVRFSDILWESSLEVRFLPPPEYSDKRNGCAILTSHSVSVKMEHSGRCASHTRQPTPIGLFLFA